MPNSAAAFDVAECEELVPAEAAARDERRDVLLRERRVEDLVAGGDGRVRREDGRRPEWVWALSRESCLLLDELA